jgi:intron-binding protein aquarius
MFGETARAAAAADVQGEAVMEGVEHLGKYVYDMQNAKFEALKANGGQLPTREVRMRDVVGDEEDGVVVEDGEDEEEDEDEELEVRSSGRHLEVEATSSVQIG